MFAAILSKGGGMRGKSVVDSFVASLQIWVFFSSGKMS